MLVIDDGSLDETDQLAEKAGAKVIRLFGSHGKGAALEAGAKRVEDADIVLLLDGDLGAAASQGELLLAPLLAGDADMAIARFPRPDGQGRLRPGQEPRQVWDSQARRRLRRDCAALRSAGADQVVPGDRAALLGRLRRRGRAHHSGAACGVPADRGRDDDVARRHGPEPAGVCPPRAAVRPRVARTAGAVEAEAAGQARELLARIRAARALAPADTSPSRWSRHCRSPARLR